MKKTQKTIQTNKVLIKLMEDKQTFSDVVFGSTKDVNIVDYIAELAKELFNVEIHVAELNDKNGEWVKTIISAYTIGTGELVSRIEKV